jgi:hypothetical protein
MLKSFFCDISKSVGVSPSSLEMKLEVKFLSFLTKFTDLKKDNDPT